MPFGLRFKQSGKKQPVLGGLGKTGEVVKIFSEAAEKFDEPVAEETEQAAKPVPSEKPLKETLLAKKQVEEKKPLLGAEELESAVEESELSTMTHEFLPIRVSSFDDLIERHGVERGSTILISGGCGTGKSTFCIQSLYNGILNGEKAVYLTFEETPEKIKRHMKANYGWDLDKLEQEKRLAILKLNPFKIARSVEASLAQQRKALLIKVEQITLPFMPDWIVVDSLSALSLAFMGNIENYRYYVRHMFEILDHYNSVNFVISETEQDPGIYSRTGIEEFLADGVVVLYNIKVGRTRERALEILKLRCSNHVKELIPYQITPKGIMIFRGTELERLLQTESPFDSFEQKKKDSLGNSSKSGKKG